MVAYSFKKRFVVPIKVGLGGVAADTLDIVPKRQTIRAIGQRRHARPGEELQLYCGLRTRHCKLIGKAICTKVSPVTIWIWSNDDLDIELGKKLIRIKELEAFAQRDGFSDIADMAAFWRTEHPDVERFEGVVINWRALP